MKHSDEEEHEPDPEIQESIFNWLAYAMATKHSAHLDEKGKKFERDVRKKRNNGEFCLRCNEKPSQKYNPEKRWNDKGFCEPCLQVLKAAGEYCETCKYAFEERYMQTESLCKLCIECGDAPRLQM